MAESRSRFFHFCADVFDVRDINFLPRCVEGDGAGKPAGRDQAEQFRFAWFELENGDGVLRAVANKKVFARLVERQRIRLRAEQIARVLPRANRFDNLVLAGINDAQRVAAAVGHNEPTSIRRQRERAGVQAGHNFGFRISDFGFWVEVNHRHRAFAGDEAGIHPHLCAVSGGTGDTVGLRPAATPIADVNFAAGEHDVVRRHAHVPNSQHAAGRGVQFGQTIGKVQRNVDFFAIR